MNDPFGRYLESVRNHNPLVHCITNYVTANACANAILAVGGAPIMADAVEEVADITQSCAALTVNIGTLSDAALQSMRVAMTVAHRKGIPIILDPVGAGASKFRTQSGQTLLGLKPTVVRGNMSELLALYNGADQTRGVDAAEGDLIREEGLESKRYMVAEMAQSMQTIVVATGPIDMISDGSTTYAVRNGHPQMRRITGTGCMLSCLIATFAGAHSRIDVDGAAAAVVLMGVCGERAHRQTTASGSGTGRFYTALMDALSTADAELFLKEGRYVRY